jgi:enamine deaminase RidA (YjgF/YER057c/UK114 family)
MTTVENFGVPWESDFGYVQALKHGDTIYISGQLANVGSELIGEGDMSVQMRQTYVNIAELLARFGATLDNVVEEVMYVTDLESAFAVAGPIRKAAYGRPDPQVANTLVGITRLALAAQLVEIKVIARV